MCIELRGFYLKARPYPQSALYYTPPLICYKSNVMMGGVYLVPLSQIAAVVQTSSCSWFASQVGQFIGTRADFIPKPICKRLALLQDQVCNGAS